MASLTINAIWIGPRLGAVHVACLSSFIHTGHRVLLHCYEAPVDCPAGVEIYDARQLMPENSIIRYRKSGSYSLFSNIYRLKILQANLGLYVDCDVFCLKEILDDEYIFGWESDAHINGAVLKIPSNSAMLTSFLAAVSKKAFVPPWLKSPQRRWLRIRRAVGLPISIDRLPWGTFGPRATTYYARENGVIDYAAPPDVFYPLPYDRVKQFVDPQLQLDDIISHRTVCVHLYQQKLQTYLGAIPPNSPLGEMLRRVAVDIAI